MRMMRVQIRFRVTGRGAFPVDMLRYDGCYPASQRDVLAIDDSVRWMSGGTRGDSEREITLEHWADRRTWVPTSDRWRSFGWSVVAGSVEVTS